MAKPDTEEIEKKRSDFLRAEYSACESKWRFLQGLRYAVIAAVITVQSYLFKFYNDTLAVFQSAVPLHGLGKTALIFIAFFGISLLGAMYLLVERLRQLYRECGQRAAELEYAFGVTDGVFSRLRKLPKPTPLPLDHNEAIQLMFALAAVYWIFLMFTGMFVTEGGLTHG